jgi:hypothetical protein
MVPVGPMDQAKMTIDTIARIYDVWSKPRTPLATAPPDITAKQALHLTRAAVNAGVSTDELTAVAS